jgi:hypothetical protein
MISRRLAAALAMTLMWAVSVSARDDGGEKYKAPAEIVATLPQFCWWWYLDNVPLDPRFSACGDYYNHFCPGLVLMKQAEKEKNPQSAYWLLKEAADNMQYTLKPWTPAECFLRPIAEMNLSRINFQIDMLKYKKR